jgi:hypothetical protein
LAFNLLEAYTKRRQGKREYRTASAPTGSKLCFALGSTFRCLYIEHINQTRKLTQQINKSVHSDENRNVAALFLRARKIPLKLRSKTEG